MAVDLTTYCSAPPAAGRERMSAKGDASKYTEYLNSVDNFLCDLATDELGESLLFVPPRTTSHLSVGVQTTVSINEPEQGY